MTAPRELSLVETAAGPRLSQAPARELEALRDCTLATLGDQAVDGTIVIAEDAPDRLDLVADLVPGAATELTLSVLAGANEETRVGLDVPRGVLFLDRSRSGQVDFARSFAGRREVLVSLTKGHLDLRILVDHTSIEVFAAGGAAVMTAAVYPDEARHAVRAQARGGTASIASLKLRVLSAAR